MGNRLAYIDQTFLLSLRALEHGPIGQFTWVYEHDVDLDALREFHRNLGAGLLGRRVERSPIPFGRHSWISWSSPDELEVATVALPRSEVNRWSDEQAQRWVDPEYGPPWRLVVQPLTEGGAAITFVCSHTVADGVGMMLAVIDAVNGKPRDFGYPAANARTKSQAIREDLRAALRSVPDMVNAVVSLPAAARDAARWKAAAESASGASSAISVPSRATQRVAKRAKKAAIKRNRHRPVKMSWAVVHLDIPQWDGRAKELGGTSNSLFLAVAARIAQALGNVGPDGWVNCAIPVNVRAEDDTRGNALNGLPLSVDPDGAVTDLRPVRASLKAALSALGTDPNAFAAPMALTPVIPKVVARGIELVALKNAAATCTNLGDIDPAVNRPDGTDADYFFVRGRIARLECRTSFIQRSGGYMVPLSSGRVNGSIFLVGGYATTDPAFSQERFRDLMHKVMADFGLTASLEFATTSD